MKKWFKAKQLIASVLALAMVLPLGACSNKASSGTSSTSENASGGGKIKIGVSIWSSTDVLGSQSKHMLDAAAKALGNVQLIYVDQGHVSEKVTASVETLCAAGCKGIIICNSADSEMASCINTCNENHVYLAQFYRMINKTKSPQIYQQAQKSKYFIGAVHEDEVVNGYNLVMLLAKKGRRHICLEGWTPGDATFLERWEGYKKGIADWNKAHPSDKITMTQPVYANTSSEEGANVTKSFMNSHPEMDSLIVAGGGGDPLVGSVGAIKNAGKTGKIGVVSTDFLSDLDKQLATGGMDGESGGHFCDPLYALMMVYNTIKGKYQVSVDPSSPSSFYEIKFPYLYVSSSQDYDSYKKYFLDSAPYTSKEIKDMTNDSFDQLSNKAAALSIKGVQSRHGNT
ncbi:MAG TPA: hypothetical protein DG942_00265 [Ruminococcaceae bacterium]|jgi:ribose transport system substrate-binding protein|nr:hypothetical protein [Oscillospiraceae bacterium]